MTFILTKVQSTLFPNLCIVSYSYNYWHQNDNLILTEEGEEKKMLKNMRVERSNQKRANRNNTEEGELVS